MNACRRKACKKEYNHFINELREYAFKKIMTIFQNSFALKLKCRCSIIAFPRIASVCSESVISSSELCMICNHNYGEILHISLFVDTGYQRLPHGICYSSFFRDFSLELLQAFFRHSLICFEKVLLPCLCP